MVPSRWPSAALDGGAVGLCVALVQEGVELRRAGIDAPILVLSEQPASEIEALVEHRLIATVASRGYAASLAAAAQRFQVVQAVHLKVDTGMHRAGCDPGDAVSIAMELDRDPNLAFSAVFSHFACADDPAAPSNQLQRDSFGEVLADLDRHGVRPPLTHAANSAAAVADVAARFDFVRLGIAIYGISPGLGVDSLLPDLRPALSLKARVSTVRRIEAGEGASYGLRYHSPRPTTVAVLPIGYADGVPRRLFACAGEVLLGGRRRRLAGVVTMDQLLLDCGDDPVAPGDEAVLLGRQGSEVVTAEEWAERLGTIGYEIVCGISKRIERHYL